jgi:L-asparaginase
VKKILVVFTGGTIGSKVTNKIINVDEQQGYVLLEKFKERSKLEVEFEVIQPLNILSENCTPKDWSKLISALKNIKSEEFDGIIITHGTDTLPYTAAMISYTFAGTHIPIVLTASNYALDQLHSNGINNFISSVEFICNSGIPGIFVVFQNNNGTMKIYLGSRIVEANPIDDEFSGFGKIDLGTIKDGLLIRNEDTLNPSLTALGAHREAPEINDLKFDNSILAIRPYPGLDYRFFQFNQSKPCAIIHGLYHSSTACIKEGDVSLPEYVKYCTELGIDFYMASFKNISDNLYITSQELLSNGAIPLQNISMEAAITKLWLAYNLKLQNPKEFVMRNIYFEYLK